MKHSKLAIALVSCLCGLMLQGCDASKTSPTTNNGQTSSSLIPRKDQNTFAFNNKMGTKIDSVVITSLKNPKKVVMESSKLDCANICKLVLPKDKAGEDLLFTFNGTNRKIVAAYIWLQNSRKSILHLNSAQLGYYVVYRMKQNNQIYQDNPLKLIARFKKLFSNYKNPNYALLGDYFKAKVIQGNLTEKEFYDKLNRDLSNNTVLPGNVIPVTAPANTGIRSVNEIQLPAIQLGRIGYLVAANGGVENIPPPPSTQTPPFVPVDVMKQACQSTAALKLSDSLKTLSGFIPGIGGMALSGLFDYGVVTLAASCPVYDIQNVMQSIDALSNRVDELDKQMISLNYRLEEIGAELLVKTSVEKITGDFTDNFTKYGQSFDEYYNNFNGFDGEENKFKDLAEFVAKNGGFAALMNDTRKARFQNAMRNTTDQVYDFFNLLPDQKITALDTTLTTLYKDENQIPGDVINLRIKANVLINYFTSKMITASTASRAMLHDKINIVLSALALNEITPKWLDEHQMGSFCTSPIDGKIISWQNAHDFVDSITENKLAFLQKTLVGDDCKVADSSSLTHGGCSKMYPPLKGFPDELADSMKSHNCSYKSQYTDPATNTQVETILPGVVEWHTKTANNKPYVLAECLSDDSQTPVRSKYYTNGGNQVRNLFGALVPGTQILPGTQIQSPSNDNMWPNRFDAVQSYVPATSSGINNLTSNLEFSLDEINGNVVNKKGLKINSTKVKQWVWNPGGYTGYVELPVLDFVTQDDGRVSNSVYWKSDDALYKPLSTITGSDTHSNLILNKFSSKIISGYCPSPYEKCGGDNTMFNETVYLSFELKGITYAFGLKIKNPDVNKQEAINVVCLATSQCHQFWASQSIKWNDGTYVGLTNTNDASGQAKPHNLSLTIGAEAP
jgi:hypothetical protein